MSDKEQKEYAGFAEKVESLEDQSSGAGTVDPIVEKKLLRKIDLHLLPPLFVLFLMAFLDRTNIGMSFSKRMMMVV